MKKLFFKIALIAIVTFGLNGCYTIVWVPGSEFPTEDNSSTSVYYDDTYYGGYYYFYDSPWWWDFTPPVSSGFATGSRDENSNILIPRNSDGRGIPERVPEVQVVQPPSRNAPTGTGDVTSSGNSGSRSSETRVNNTSSSGSGNSSGRESSSNGGNTTRNNDGGRSSGGRK